MRRFISCLIILASSIFLTYHYTYSGGIIVHEYGGLSGASTTTTAASACPSGTYKFAWNGDYTSDTDKGCIASTPTDGTVVDVVVDTTALGANSTNKAFFTNVDDYISWSGSADEIVNDIAGTIYFDIWVPAGHTSANTSVIEVYVDSQNSIKVYYDGTDNDVGKMRVTHKSANEVAPAAGYVTSANMSNATWYIIGYSWDISVGTYGQISVNVDGGSWTTADGTDANSVNAWPTSPTVMLIGEKDSAITGAEDIYIDNVYSLTGYQTVHP